MCTVLRSACEASAERDLCARACRFTYRWGTALTILLVVIWPVLALPATVFSKGYFTFWTIIAMIWGILASAAMIFLPIVESKDGIVTTAKNVAAGNRTERHDFAQEVDVSKHNGGAESVDASKHNGGAMPAKEGVAVPVMASDPVYGKVTAAEAV